MTRGTAQALTALALADGGAVRDQEDVAGQDVLPGDASVLNTLGSGGVVRVVGTLQLERSLRVVARLARRGAGVPGPQLRTPAVVGAGVSVPHRPHTAAVRSAGHATGGVGEVSLVLLLLAHKRQRAVRSPALRADRCALLAADLLVANSVVRKLVGVSPGTSVARVRNARDGGGVVPSPLAVDLPVLQLALKSEGTGHSPARGANGRALVAASLGVARIVVGVGVRLLGSPVARALASHTSSRRVVALHADKLEGPTKGGESLGALRLAMVTGVLLVADRPVRLRTALAPGVRSGLPHEPGDDSVHETLLRGVALRAILARACDAARTRGVVVVGNAGQLELAGQAVPRVAHRVADVTSVLLVAVRVVRVGRASGARPLEAGSGDTHGTAGVVGVQAITRTLANQLKAADSGPAHGALGFACVASVHVAAVVEVLVTRRRRPVDRPALAGLGCARETVGVVHTGAQLQVLLTVLVEAGQADARVTTAPVSAGARGGAHVPCLHRVAVGVVSPVVRVRVRPALAEVGNARDTRGIVSSVDCVLVAVQLKLTRCVVALKALRLAMVTAALEVAAAVVSQGVGTFVGATEAQVGHTDAPVLVGLQSTCRVVPVFAVARELKEARAGEVRARLARRVAQLAGKPVGGAVFVVCVGVDVPDGSGFARVGLAQGGPVLVTVPPTASLLVTRRVAQVFAVVTEFDVPSALVARLHVGARDAKVGGSGVCTNLHLHYTVTRDWNVVAAAAQKTCLLRNRGCRDGQQQQRTLHPSFPLVHPGKREKSKTKGSPIKYRN
eukprot:Hpha_TRINITY_DN15080_c0_g1::TRINITY_DN15080_c0_g1_i1::g.124990::m.124990